jgi:hypothetical protein
MTTPDTCPHCSADLQGEKIPRGYQKWFGTTHFSRAITWKVQRGRTVAYRCPDCNGT